MSVCVIWWQWCGCVDGWRQQLATAVRAKLHALATHSQLSLSLLCHTCTHVFCLHDNRVCVVLYDGFQPVSSGPTNNTNSSSSQVSASTSRRAVTTQMQQQQAAATGAGRWSQNGRQLAYCVHLALECLSCSIQHLFMPHTRFPAACPASHMRDDHPPPSAGRRSTANDYSINTTSTADEHAPNTTSSAAASAVPPGIARFQESLCIKGVRLSASLHLVFELYCAKPAVAGLPTKELLVAWAATPLMQGGQVCLLNGSLCAGGVCVGGKSQPGLIAV